MQVEEIIEDLIVQSTDQSQIDYYRDLERSIRSRKVVDPAKAAVVKILEMCSQGMIDPWNVDLTKMSGIMAEFMGGDVIDFQFAGRAMAEAWSVLRAKSEWKPHEEPEDELMDDVPENNQYAVNNDKISDFVPALPIRFTRPVSLIEVIEEVKKSFSRKPKVRQKVLPVSFSVEKLNAEDPEDGMMRVLDKIRSVDRDEIPMSSVWGTTRKDQASFFLYSLFLHRDGRIELSQEGPESDIIIRKNMEGKDY